MNSYPLELIAQLAPVMFVAGLNPPLSSTTGAVGTTSPPQPPPPTHHSRNPSLTTLIPGGVESFRPPPPPQTRSHTPPRPDPFVILTSRLRDILVHQRKIIVWDAPTTDNQKVFQVVLVDKDVKFPPRKVESSGGSPIHSPLSPLTPSSPLHPDGLIAPIWIRKHTMLVPAVFVLFIRLFEADDPGSYYAYSLGAEYNAEFEQRLKDLADRRNDRNDKDKDVDRVKELERHKDTELAALIAQRKRSTNERGIKLTVVLLASRKLLDDSASGSAPGLLDTRLTFIRRQSGLDSRAALFVLSPIPREELLEFAKSLQTALWDPAVDYYTAHSKRVRQKRNRHQAQSAQTTSHRPTPSIVSSSSSSNTLNISSITSSLNNPPAPLKPEGWTVRYEYKMASFAELRGEYEVALKHYQDAYAALTMLFMAPGSSLAIASVGTAMSTSTSSSSTTGIAPSAGSGVGVPAAAPPGRTKRWAEAKVLADTINIKIVKLYLYNNETGLALAQQRLHVRTFPVLAGFAGAMTNKTSGGASVGAQILPSSGPASEEGSYEYWSWVSRMWCVFAEMLVEGTRIRPHSNGPSLVIPIHRPRLPPSSNPSSQSNSRNTTPIPESLLPGVNPGVNPTHALMHPGWYYLLAAEYAEKKVGRFVEGLKEVNRPDDASEQKDREQKMGHLKALIGDVLELYTKSYELFKAFSNPPSSTSSNTTSTQTHTITASISNMPENNMNTSASNASNVSNISNSSAAAGSATGGTGRLALYIAHRIALTYALFPDPNPQSHFDNNFLKDSKDSEDPLNPDSTSQDSESKSPSSEKELGSFFSAVDHWANTLDKDEDGLGSESESNFTEFKGKDPEKLALAARFLARIAKSYWREGGIASSSSSTYPGYPAYSGYLTHPIPKLARNTDDERSWGWSELLVPLLRTWSGILKELVGRGVRDIRELRYTVKAPKEIISQNLERTLEKLEPHLESYIRVLVSRISVDRDVEFSRKKEEMEIQRELTKMLGMWNWVQGGLRELRSDVNVIKIDNTETQPIFDTSAAFWYGQMWISSSSSSSKPTHTKQLRSSQDLNQNQESTPFQVTLTAPARVAIDKLDWAELRVGFVFEYEGYGYDSYEGEDEEGDEGEEEREGEDETRKTLEDREEEVEQRLTGGDSGEVEAQMELRTQEIKVIIRKIPESQSEDVEPSELNEYVRSIEVGHLSFGGGFDNNVASLKRTEKIILTPHSTLRWLAGQAIIVTGSVGVSAGRGIGRGTIRISSLVLRLNSPVSPDESAPVTLNSSDVSNVVLEIPLHVPARRGIPPPLTFGGGAFAGLGNIQGAQITQARWFSGFVELAENKIKIPRWVPVKRREINKGVGYECVEVYHRTHPVTLLVSHSGVAYVGEDYPLEVVVKGCKCVFGGRDEGEEGETSEEEEKVEVVIDVLLQPVESDVTAVNTISIGEHQSNTMIKGIPLGELALHPRRLRLHSEVATSVNSISELKKTLWIKNTGGAGDRVVDMSVRTRPNRRRKPSKSAKNAPKAITPHSIHSSPPLPHLETETLETVTIPCIEPLNVQYDVGYRRRVDPEVSLRDRPKRPWWLLDSEESGLSGNEDGPGIDHGDNWAERVEMDVEAVVRTTIGCVTGAAPSGVEVEKVLLSSKDPQSMIVKILSSEMSLEPGTNIENIESTEDTSGEQEFPLEFLPGDELSDICRIGISAHRDDEDHNVGADGNFEEMASPGTYEVFWRRILSKNTRGTLSSTLFPLPSLRPPVEDLIALLDIASTAKLHEPLPMSLTIRNRHPTRTADIYVRLEFPPGTAPPVGDSTAMSTTTSVAAAGDSASVSLLQGVLSSQGNSSSNPGPNVGSGFVVSGPRASRVPLLLAGTEERLVWMLIPVECGHIRLPKIRVIDRRKAVNETAGMLGSGAGGKLGNGGTGEGVNSTVTDDGNLPDVEEGKRVKVVDVRLERRSERKKQQTGTILPREEEEEGRIGTVFVLP